MHFLFFHAALLTEIKEISDKKCEEDDVLLSIATGNRLPISPQLEFLFPDHDIHQDLYRLIKHSCGEVCTTEQLHKIMKIWTTLMEPMLGVPPCSQGLADGKRAIRNNYLVTGSVICTVEEKDRNAASASGAAITLRQLNIPRNGDGDTPPEHSSSSRVCLVDADDAVKDDASHDVNMAAAEIDPAPLRISPTGTSVVDAIIKGPKVLPICRLFVFLISSFLLSFLLSCLSCLGHRRNVYQTRKKARLRNLLKMMRILKLRERRVNCLQMLIQRTILKQLMMPEQNRQMLQTKLLHIGCTALERRELETKMLKDHLRTARMFLEMVMFQ